MLWLASPAGRPPGLDLAQPCCLLACSRSCLLLPFYPAEKHPLSLQMERLDVKVFEPLKLYGTRLKQTRVSPGEAALPSPGQDTAPRGGKLVWEGHG